MELMGTNSKEALAHALRKVAAAALAAFFALALAFCAPARAFADTDDEGSVDEPNPAAAAQTQGSSGDNATGGSEATPCVTVSEDGVSASLEGCAFALDGFSRSQVGGNGDVDGVYEGYRYYVSNEPGSLVAIAADGFVVVYLSEGAAADAGMDPADPADQEQVKSLVMALDAANSKGGALLSADDEWIFTSDQVYNRDGVEFRFDQELKPGQYSACVIGADGSDVTDADNPLHVGLTHADSARIVPADSVEVVAAPSGVDALVSFIANIDFSPLWVTLKTTGVAIVFIFVLGLAAAYFSLRIPSRAQDIADSIFTIPMVLPPTVCGFLLLLLLGSNTPVGRWFDEVGFPLVFSWQATVIAAVVVAFPLMYRSARGAFESLDPNMLDAARTLGWSNRRIFFKLMLPLSWSSIAAGTVLAFARALGEFGCTLFLAGNYIGITRTVPIAIYFEWMNGNTEVALFWTVVIMIFSFVVILFINLWSRRTTKYRRPVKEN